MNTLEGTIKEHVYSRLGVDLTLEQYDSIPQDLFVPFCSDKVLNDHEQYQDAIDNIVAWVDNQQQAWARADRAACLDNSHYPEISGRDETYDVSEKFDYNPYNGARYGKGDY